MQGCVVSLILLTFNTDRCKHHVYFVISDFFKDLQVFSAYRMKEKSSELQDTFILAVNQISFFVYISLNINKNKYSLKVLNYRLSTPKSKNCLRLNYPTLHIFANHLFLYVLNISGVY